MTMNALMPRQRLETAKAVASHLRTLAWAGVVLLSLLSFYVHTLQDGV